MRDAELISPERLEDAFKGNVVDPIGKWFKQ